MLCAIGILRTILGGMMSARMRGNPADRARGIAVRALLGAMVKPGKPVPLHEVQNILKLSRVAICQHLLHMRDVDRRIKGYSTAKGEVQVW